MSCEKIIGKRLMKLQGVRNVAVSKDDGLAVIEGERNVSPEQASQLLHDTHYEVDGVA